MFVPIVPFVPHTTVINKTIVYSDTVLPLKDTGNNLKVTSISNVSEFSLESCLKTIFESNPNVIFNTIQYSKNDKKVYFYTNQDITTKAYEESKFTNYKPLTSSSEILEEAKNILLYEKNNNSDCISLCSISQLLKEFEYNYNRLKENYCSIFENISKTKFGEYSRVIIYDFDYKNKILKIGFNRWGSSGDYSKIYFKKANNDLYIVKSECFYAKEIFSVLSSKLSQLYDEFIKFEDFKDDNNSKHIKSINSNFNVDISHYGVSFLVKSVNNIYKNDFKLFSPSYADKYIIDCNSGIINETFSGKEIEFFKRIYVKIDDCPKWCKSKLYEMRKEQIHRELKFEERKLLEKQKIEDEIKYKEMKKQKRLELTRKIFPFLKK